MRIVGGKFRGRRLSPPPKTGVRPSSDQLRETLFNICQLSIEGARFLDLCAGTGAVGFEAVSRGAAHVTLVEKDRGALLSIERNRDLLALKEEISLIRSDLWRALDQLDGEQFDLIFADPPYGATVSEELLAERLLKEVVSRSLLAPNGSLFIEERQPLQKIPPELKQVSERRIGPAHLSHFTWRSS